MIPFLAAFAIISPSPGVTAEPKKNTNPAVQIDLSRFPTLKGKVKSLVGSFNVYTPPEVGDTVSLSVSQLISLKKGKSHLLRFQTADPKREIATLFLPDRPTLKSAKFYGNGVFKNLRLESRGVNGMMRIDVISCVRGNARVAQVWIVLEEEGVTDGAMLLECRIDGEFPKRKSKSGERPGVSRPVKPVRTTN